MGIFQFQEDAAVRLKAISEPKTRHATLYFYSKLFHIQSVPFYDFDVDYYVRVTERALSAGQPLLDAVEGKVNKEVDPTACVPNEHLKLQVEARIRILAMECRRIRAGCSFFLEQLEFAKPPPSCDFDVDFFVRLIERGLEWGEDLADVLTGRIPLQDGDEF